MQLAALYNTSGKQLDPPNCHNTSVLPQDGLKEQALMCRYAADDGLAKQHIMSASVSNGIREQQVLQEHKRICTEHDIYRKIRRSFLPNALVLAELSSKMSGCKATWA